MDLETLRSTLEQANLASLGLGFLAGLVFSFNPVAFAAIPVSLAYVTKTQDSKQAVLWGGLFILGMILTHILLGLVAGFGGQWVQTLLGRFWGLVLGPLLILLGLMWPGWIKIPLPSLTLRAKRINHGLGALLLGIPFSLAICPFCTPALVIMLGVAAASGSPLYGVSLLFAFALGRAVPIMIGAYAMGWLESLKFLSNAQRIFEMMGALLLIFTGIYLFSASFVEVPQFKG